MIALIVSHCRQCHKIGLVMFKIYILYQHKRLNYRYWYKNYQSQLKSTYFIIACALYLQWCLRKLGKGQVFINFGIFDMFRSKHIQHNILSISILWTSTRFVTGCFRIFNPFHSINDINNFKGYYFSNIGIWFFHRDVMKYEPNINYELLFTFISSMYIYKQILWECFVTKMECSIFVIDDM